MANDLFYALVGNWKLIEPEFTENLIPEAWKQSPFVMFKHFRNSSIGAAGVRLVCSLCQNYGVNITNSKGTKSDKRIGKTLIEIKFATLGKNGKYTFNQLRTEGYDVVILLGITPTDAHLWVIPREVAVGHGRQQHGPETYMLQLNPVEMPEWMAAYYGHSPERIGALLRGIGKKPRLKVRDDMKRAHVLITGGASD